MKICVVDDDALLREALEALLIDAGFEVRCAEDGLDALDTLRAWPADVVVCDLLMPGAEGFELLRTVRKKLPELRFIMMSGAQGELSHFLDHAPVLGADATLRKPFKPQELIDAIKAVGSPTTGTTCVGPEAAADAGLASGLANDLANEDQHES